MLNPGTAREQDVPTQGRYELKAGDTFSLRSAGGGDYGDPAKRDRAALARDMAEGYVSPESAKRDYGYTGQISGNGLAVRDRDLGQTQSEKFPESNALCRACPQGPVPRPRE